MLGGFFVLMGLPASHALTLIEVKSSIDPARALAKALPLAGRQSD